MDIYEVMNKTITDKTLRLSPRLFNQEDRKKLNSKDQKLFDLLRDISSVETNILDSEIKIHPMSATVNGQRPFSIEDITDNDYQLLISMDFSKIPLCLKALVADLLWTQRREISAAHIAAQAYWKIFQLCYQKGNIHGVLCYIRKATDIALQTQQKDLYFEICEWLDGFLRNKAYLNDSKYIFYTLRVMELFLEQKSYNVSSFLPVLENIILLNNNISAVEQAYELKTKCLNKLKKNEAAKQNNISLAKYYIDYAEKIMQTNANGVMLAVQCFQKAITLYRNNGEYEQAKTAHRKLIKIQKQIPSLMVPISLEFDIQGVIDNININMEGLSFEECVIRLTQVVYFDSKESIKNSVIDEYNQYPLDNFFGRNLINSQGQTIFTLPPLDIQDMQNNQKLLELHMWQSISKKQRFIGDVYLKNLLRYIREKFTIDNSMLSFLVKDNPIIPLGRERIFQSGISMFLRGEFYEAMHILAPQTENLFRNIAKEVGGLTVTLENDGSSMEKVLSAIFNLPEMLECYDNDILFIFKGMLNEQAGGNIRNEVAHGIIEESACSSGLYLYFGAALIKLLSFTSFRCCEIFQRNEKLKHFKVPDDTALKLVEKKNNLVDN